MGADMGADVGAVGIRYGKKDTNYLLHGCGYGRRDEVSSLANKLVFGGQKESK